MEIVELINKKRLNQALTKEEIEFIITEYMNDKIKDYQMSSLLMAICLNGMTEVETTVLTTAMVNSGERLDLSAIPGVKVDKHSTGGVGDKTTLILAPLVASCGVPIVKMSGRGLGFSGGTIDKLESIPGFNTNLSLNECIAFCQKSNVVLAAQTGNLVPADKKIYALRDVSGTVESIPLIASSIMSKKIASGADKVIIDLKVGNGAFMKNMAEAQTLGKLLIEIGQQNNLPTSCLITDMNQPLGSAVGNALEVLESMAVLKGSGPNDLVALVIELASRMVQMAKNITLEAAKNEVTNNLQNGQAYQKFLELVTNQQGRINEITLAANKKQVLSPLEGYISAINCAELGELVRRLGGGRFQKEDSIDYGVGLLIKQKIGSYVTKNDPLVEVYYNQKEVADLDFANCFTITNEIVKPTPIIYEILE